MTMRRWLFLLLITCSYYNLSQQFNPEIQRPLTFKKANEHCEKQGTKMSTIPATDKSLEAIRHNLFWVEQNASDYNSCLAMKYTNNYQLKHENCSENLYYICELGVSNCTDVNFALKNKCYEVSNEVSDFLNAKIKCEQNDGSLLAINNTQEHDFIKNLIQENTIRRFENITGNLDKIGTEDVPAIWVGVIYEDTRQIWVTNEGIQVDYDFNLNVSQSYYANGSCLTRTTELEIDDCNRKHSFFCDYLDEEVIAAELESSSNTTNTTEDEILSFHSSTSLTTVKEVQHGTEDPTPNAFRNNGCNNDSFRMGPKCYDPHLDTEATFSVAENICADTGHNIALFENTEISDFLINIGIKYKYQKYTVASCLQECCRFISFARNFISENEKNCANNMFFICEFEITSYTSQNCSHNYGKCYKLVHERIPAINASEECRKLNGTLACIKTPREEAILQLIQEDQWWNNFTSDKITKHGFRDFQTFWSGTKYKNGVIRQFNSSYFTPVYKICNDFQTCGVKSYNSSSKEDCTTYQYFFCEYNAFQHNILVNNTDPTLHFTESLKIYSAPTKSSFTLTNTEFSSTTLSLESTHNTTTDNPVYQTSMHIIFGIIGVLVISIVLRVLAFFIKVLVILIRKGQCNVNRDNRRNADGEVMEMAPMRQGDDVDQQQPPHQNE